MVVKHEVVTVLALEDWWASSTRRDGAFRQNDAKHDAKHIHVADESPN